MFQLFKKKMCIINYVSIATLQGKSGNRYKICPCVKLISEQLLDGFRNFVTPLFLPSDIQNNSIIKKEKFIRAIFFISSSINL